MRRMISWIGVAALLFAQLLIPVHACPMGSMDREAMTMPCDSMTSPSDVCHEHGRQGAQAVDQSPANAGVDAFVPAFVATIPVAAAMPHSPGIATAAAVPTTAPPIYICATARCASRRSLNFAAPRRRGPLGFQRNERHRKKRPFAWIARGLGSDN